MPMPLNIFRLNLLLLCPSHRRTFLFSAISLDHDICSVVFFLLVSPVKTDFQFDNIVVLVPNSHVRTFTPCKTLAESLARPGFACFSGLFLLTSILSLTLASFLQLLENV